MDVWIRRCRKRSKCNYCPEAITNGSYMVVVKLIYWVAKDDSNRRWIRYLRFHPQCWIDQAVEKLEKQPKIETRGAKRSALSDKDRAARIKILARRASVTQRIRAEISKPKEEQSIDAIIHLGDVLNKLRDEIEPFGGVPKSWT